MSKTQPGYRAYLLRLWQAYTEGELLWRASLESPHTRQRRGFASLADLFTFLESEFSEPVQGQAAGDTEKEVMTTSENFVINGIGNPNSKMKGKGG